MHRLDGLNAGLWKMFEVSTRRFNPSSGSATNFTLFCFFPEVLVDFRLREGSADILVHC